MHRLHNYQQTLMVELFVFLGKVTVDPPQLDESDVGENDTLEN